MRIRQNNKFMIFVVSQYYYIGFDGQSRKRKTVAEEVKHTALTSIFHFESQ